MELKLFNKVFRVGVTRKFEADDLLGEHMHYGGILVGKKDGESYIFVQWAESDNVAENSSILGRLVSIV